jgi:uncharacterized protein involved in exopolysaccharide biosynthesis
MMNFKLFLTILRSRYQLIIFTLVVTVATAAALTQMQSSRYIATTSLVLNFQGDNPFERAGIPAQLSSAYVATQLDIINSRNVAMKVVDSEQLADNPKMREAFLESNGDTGSIRVWLAQGLLNDLLIEPSRDSRVIRIGYESTSPEWAAQMANAFAQAYIDTTLELNLEPARQSAEWFDDQLKELRARLEEAQARLTAFQQEKGIVAIDERLDTETSRLNELSKKYVAAQAETYDVKSRQLGQNHPEYTSAVKREGSLRYSMEQQKQRILELKKQRDELAVLAREVENEQKNYEATLQSYYQTRLQSQFNQTNIAILNPAVPPSKPSSPNVMLNMVSAVFLGLLLSLALAIGLELFNRRVRTPEDVSTLLGIRVLASV